MKQLNYKSYVRIHVTDHDYMLEVYTQDTYLNIYALGVNTECLLSDKIP